MERAHRLQVADVDDTAHGGGAGVSLLQLRLRRLQRLRVDVDDHRLHALPAPPNRRQLPRGHRRINSEPLPTHFFAAEEQNLV